jgi:tetratricopeptide (TPR) repeat protein
MLQRQLWQPILLVIPDGFMPTRREKIEALLRDEPGDPFLRYSLACEYDNEERFDEALDLFRGLMSDSPPHVASFFRGAQLLVKLDRVEDARARLREGIETARQQGDLHAAGEMGELLANLGSLGES